MTGEKKKKKRLNRSVLLAKKIVIRDGAGVSAGGRREREARCGGPANNGGPGLGAGPRAPGGAEAAAGLRSGACGAGSVGHGGPGAGGGWPRGPGAGAGALGQAADAGGRWEARPLLRRLPRSRGPSPR